MDIGNPPEVVTVFTRNTNQLWLFLNGAFVLRSTGEHIDMTRVAELAGRMAAALDVRVRIRSVGHGTDLAETISMSMSDEQLSRLEFILPQHTGEHD